MIKNETCLITGGAGFIGSHLVDALAETHLNNKVIILDNLSTGKLTNISHHFNDHIDKAYANYSKNKEEQKEAFIISNNNESVTFIKGDIRDRDLLQNVFKKNKPNYIFHLAAVASVPKSIIDPETTHDVNVTGTFNLLNAARMLNESNKNKPSNANKKNSKDGKEREPIVKKFVFSSSCAVYGDPDPKDLPLKETAPTKPMSPYATSKLTGEAYCHIFSEAFDLPTVCLRYFNVYGPRQDPHGDYAAVIPKFIEHAKNNKPLTINGNGSQTRDFIYFKDVINANILAAINNGVQGTINIGTGNQTDIDFLARSILSLTGNELDSITYKIQRDGDIKDSYADNTKLEQMLKCAKSGFPLNLKSGLSCLFDIEDLLLV